MHARGQRAVRLERGVLAGDGDQRDVRAGSRAALRERARRPTGAARRPARRRGELAPRPLERVGRAVDGDHDVARRRRRQLPERASASRFAGVPITTSRASTPRARAASCATSSAARCRRSGCGRPAPASSCRHRSRARSTSRPRRAIGGQQRSARRDQRAPAAVVDEAPADSTFGPMLPGGNSPSSKPRWLRRRVIRSTARSQRVPKSSATRGRR